MFKLWVAMGWGGGFLFLASLSYSQRVVVSEAEVPRSERLMRNWLTPYFDRDEIFNFYDEDELDRFLKESEVNSEIALEIKEQIRNNENVKAAAPWPLMGKFYLTEDFRQKLPQQFIDRLYAEQMIMGTFAPYVSSNTRDFFKGKLESFGMEEPDVERIMDLIQPMHGRFFLFLDSRMRDFPTPKVFKIFENNFSGFSRLNPLSVKLVISSQDELAAIAREYSRDRDVQRSLTMLQKKRADAEGEEFTVNLEEFLPSQMLQMMNTYASCDGLNCRLVALLAGGSSLPPQHEADFGDVIRFLDGHRALKSYEELRPGDFLDFATIPRGSLHNAIYLGGGFVLSKNGSAKEYPSGIYQLKDIEQLYLPFGGQTRVFRIVGSSAEGAYVYRSATYRNNGLSGKVFSCLKSLARSAVPRIPPIF